MRDIILGVRKWVNAGEPFALATVVRTWRSAPRPVGSSLAVSAESEMLGSVSGGCVEKSVIREALGVLENNVPKLVNYGVSDDEAWEVGLSCGGKIGVFIEPFLAFGNQNEQGIWEELNQAIDQNISVVLISNLTSKSSEHSLLDIDKDEITGISIDPSLKEFALQASHERSNKVLDHQGNKYFIRTFLRRERMILIGSAHITVELISLAKQFDFETIVIDPRDTFASKTKYPVPPDEIHIKWPQEILAELQPDAETYAVTLSHDPKIDDAALEILLNSNVPYIGALGSSKTHQKRIGRLKSKGFSDEQIDRINAPIGLDIKALSAKEIALSVMAEVIQVRNTIYT
jgi:xanthine dehydrogenase accessory factor